MSSISVCNFIHFSVLLAEFHPLFFSTTLCIWNNLSLTYHVNPFAQDTRLILTGPKQGLALLDAMHVEIDLKIKGRHGQDRELSKGVLFYQRHGAPITEGM